MIPPDVNILVYAHWEDVADHTAYRAWLESVVNGDRIRMRVAHDGQRLQPL